ncbi:MAG: integrase [Gramella sp.]|nr:integrase [Christiangramia sp.]
MKSRSTFSVLFWIKTSKDSNDSATLYARITVDGKRVNLSLKHEIPLHQWDARRSKVSGRSPEAREINEYIQHVRAELFSCYRDLKLEGEFIDAESVKKAYLKEEENLETLSSLFKYHNDNENHNLSPATISHYCTTQRYLLEFVMSRYQTRDFVLKKLDYAFVVGFETFLRKYHSKDHYGYMSNNGAMKHIQRLRKMIRIAMKLGWINHNPLQGYVIKMERNEREYLTENELEKICLFKTGLKRLELVQDLFLFSCYTGISYGDIMNLEYKNLQDVESEKWIITKRAKTNNAVRLPLLSIPLRIINKYLDHPRRRGTKLLPELSNQKLNSYLKELADKCEIRKNLTFHMARHTFATTVTLTNGVPIETVSKILGHSRLATTQIYARVLDKKIAADMSVLKGVLEKSDS